MRAIAADGGEWLAMAEAPRDGTPIIIAVNGGTIRGFLFHELPYPVRFVNGRWCYARWDTPLFEWHRPRAWRPWQAVNDARQVAA